jgi:DNA-binding ferritin-like protein
MFIIVPDPPIFIPAVKEWKGIWKGAPMDQVCKLANLYTASLRGIYLIEQYCHWTTRGLSFYGDHLLFERLYKQAADDADAAAERFIGLFGEDAMDYPLQHEFISKLLAKYSDHAMEKLIIALTIEKDFLAFAEQMYNEFDKENVLTLGLEDMIPEHSSNRETAVYLLQQALEKQGKE